MLIGGFIVSGSEDKKVIVRGIGPSLGLPGALLDPVLEIHDVSGKTVATNDNWQDGDAKAVRDSGVAPKNPAEAAIVQSLAPGAYTAVLSGAKETTGLGLVEVYDLDATAPSKLANVSTRGRVLSGDNVMIGGLIVVGDSPTQVLLRAIGPSLPLSGALQDPTIDLFDEHGTLIASNDNWRSDQETAISATKAAPTKDAESAIIISLNPGLYTAVVRGKNDTTGIGLVEAYQLDN